MKHTDTKSHSLPLHPGLEQRVDDDDVTVIQGDAEATAAVQANYRPVDLYRIAKPGAPVRKLVAAGAALFGGSAGAYYVLDRYTQAPTLAHVGMAFGAGLVLSIIATGTTYDTH